MKIAPVFQAMLLTEILLESCVTTASAATGLFGSPSPYVAPLTSIPSPAPGGHVWYVDVLNGSDTNNGLSKATAFRSLDRATLYYYNVNGVHSQLEGGDVVVIEPGTYYQTIHLSYDHTGSTSISGTSSYYTTIMGDPSASTRPVIVGNQPYQCAAYNGSGAIQVFASYLRISGLEISAPGYDGPDAVNEGMSSSDSRIVFPAAVHPSTSPIYANGPSSFAGITAAAGPGNCSTSSSVSYVGSGIQISGVKPSGSAPYYATVHHVVVDNNIIHDVGAGGVGSAFADYIIIENNIVYNTSNYFYTETSGISIGYSLNVSGDTNTTGYHSVAINNTTYKNQVLLNTQTIPYVQAYMGGPKPTCPTSNAFGSSSGPGSATGGCHTDGNGVSIDSLDNNPYIGNSGYTGRTLV